MVNAFRQTQKGHHRFLCTYMQPILFSKMLAPIAFLWLGHHLIQCGLLPVSYIINLFWFKVSAHSAYLEFDCNNYFVSSTIHWICAFLCFECSVCRFVFGFSCLCEALLGTALLGSALALMVAVCLWECSWQVCVVIESISAASLESMLTYGGICVPGICAQSAAQATTGLDGGFMYVSLSFLALSILIPFTLLDAGFLFFLHFPSLLH